MCSDGSSLTPHANAIGAVLLYLFAKKEKTEPKSCFFLHDNRKLIFIQSALVPYHKALKPSLNRLEMSETDLYMGLHDGNGKPSMFTPILIATLGTCAELERENIYYRLNSGRRIYIEKGGRLGRKKGSVKTHEQKEEQYKDVLLYLRKGYKIAEIAKLTDTSESTVQRLKREFQIR